VAMGGNPPSQTRRRPATPRENSGTKTPTASPTRSAKPIPRGVTNHLSPQTATRRNRGTNYRNWLQLRHAQPTPHLPATRPILATAPSRINQSPGTLSPTLSTIRQPDSNPRPTKSRSRNSQYTTCRNCQAIGTVSRHQP